VDEKWLDCHGPYAVEALFDTQFTTVLGIPLQSLRCGRLDWSDLIHLVDVKVFPAATWFVWNNREQKTKQARKRSSIETRKPHKSWAGCQPEHRSPLRQAWTPDSSGSP
jgi:hypothetical protein